MNYVIDKNAKNVWIRDNNDTIDLSPETDASTVYLNNGRTLEQELGEGSMVSNVVTVNSAMSKVIDGTYDGAYESLVFKGRSLVNLCPNKVIDYVATSDWDGFNGLGQASNTKGYSWKTLQDLKPNTKYFISCYVETFDVGEREYYLFNNNNQSTIFEDTLTIYNTGSHKWVLTSRREFTDEVFIALRCQNAYARGAIKIKNIMIIEYQEGMENWDIPYFEGLCDVKMPILRNVGKNLFDGGQVQLEKYQNYNVNNGTFSISNNNNYKITGFIPIKPNTLYRKQGKGIGDGAYYTKDKQPIKTTFCSGITFTPPSGAYYVVLNMSNSISHNDVQIEESPFTTPYQPHKSNTLTTPEEIILRSLSNGVQDTYNPLTGEYVKRVGEKILSGNEDWRNFTNTFIQKVKTIDVYMANSEQKANSGLLCDKMQTSNTTYMRDEESISCSGGSGINIWVSISKDKLNPPNRDGFKQWLQSNPIKVQYELAEPIIKKVEPKGHPFAYEDGHVILESGHQGQSLLPIMDYSTVINRTGQIKSIGEQSLRQDKQINKLEQMLISNIITMNYSNTLLKLNLTMNEVK